MDLIKEPPTPNDSDDDDDIPVGLSWTCSRQSSTNSDYSHTLSRTISNMSTTSTVSTIPITPIGEDNPVFYDDLIAENPSGIDVSHFFYYYYFFTNIQRQNKVCSYFL